MPKLVQFPVFTSRRLNLHSIDDVVSYLDTLTANIQKFWSQQAYVINALSHTGTAAGRPTASPQILDDTFYTETDSNQTFLVIDGEYTSLGQQRDVQSFTYFLS